MFLINFLGSSPVIAEEIEKFTRADPVLSRVKSLAVACWTTDPYHPCSNLGVGVSDGCFVFDFAALPSEVARPI